MGVGQAQEFLPESQEPLNSCFLESKIRPRTTIPLLATTVAPRNVLLGAVAIYLT